MFRSFFFSTLTVALLALSPNLSLAKDGESSLVCATVMPCAEDGSVLAPYDEGPCATTYQRQCSSVKANQLGTALEECYFESARKEQRQRRTIRQLRLKLKASRIR